MTKLSDCCNAPLEEYYGDEGTNHWECSKCGKPCNAVDPKPKHLEQGGERFDGYVQVGKPQPPVGYTLTTSSPVEEKGKLTEKQFDEMAEQVFKWAEEDKKIKKTVTEVLEEIAMNRDFRSGSVDYKDEKPSVSPSGQSSKPTDQKIAPSEDWEKIREDLKNRLTEAYFAFSKTKRPEFKTAYEGNAWITKHNYIAEKIVGSWVDNVMSVLSSSNEKARREGYEQGQNDKMEELESDYKLLKEEL